MLPNDFSEPLVQEVLTDMANTFFGTRKELDDMMEALDAFVEELRQREAAIALRAGFLNHLFLDERAARDFYAAIKLDSPELLLEAEFSDKTISQEIPFAFSTKGEYIKLVLSAYDATQKACHEYLNGKLCEDPEEQGRMDVTVHYKQIVKMCEIINEKVHQVNTGMSPVCVLQYAKKFNPEAEEKERITGATFGGYACSIDDKLAYRPINFDSLQLKKYPELPDHDEVYHEITSFCKKEYHRHKADIKELISNLKLRVETHYPK